MRAGSGYRNASRRLRRGGGSESRKYARGGDGLRTWGNASTTGLYHHGFNRKNKRLAHGGPEQTARPLRTIRRMWNAKFADFRSRNFRPGSSSPGGGWDTMYSRRSFLNPGISSFRLFSGFGQSGVFFYWILKPLALRHVAEAMTDLALTEWRCCERPLAAKASHSSRLRSRVWRGRSLR